MAWPLIAAVYMIVVTPGIVAFASAQRLFFKGLMEGCSRHDPLCAISFVEVRFDRATQQRSLLGWLCAATGWLTARSRAQADQVPAERV